MTEEVAEGSKNLCVKLPVQLILDFNQYWEEKGDAWKSAENLGRRDDLIAIAMKELMKRKPPRRARASIASASYDRRDAVIAFARKQAKSIIEATAEAARNRRRRAS